MRDVFIVEAVRSPLGKRGGSLATLHAADLLGAVMRAAVARAGIDAAAVGQIVAGCVSQVGEQSFNVARGAVLRRRVDEPDPARRELRGQEARPPGPEELPRALRLQVAVRGRGADREGVRHHPRGQRPLRPALTAARGPRLGGEMLRARGRARDRAGRRRGGPAHRRERHGDEAGVRRHGLTPRARVVYTTLVGVDPVTMLKGPIPATRRVLAKSGLAIEDIDVYEVNEAFASVVLAWQKECGPVPERVNPNGGAIALGHPTGATGDRLLTTALHELERTGGRRALISMCCGGGLGTGTLIERV